MNRKTTILLAILILFSLILNVSYVYAINKKDSFFEVNKQELYQGEILEMTLDISNIDYEKFEFKLNSNIETNKIYADENVEIDNNNNVVSINIDKTNMELNKISLYYEIPDSLDVGTKIELIAQILAEVQLENEDNIEETITNNEVLNTINTNNDMKNTENSENIENNTEIKVVAEQKVEVIVVEKDEEQEEQKPTDNIEQGENQEDFQKPNGITNSDMPENNEISNKPSSNMPNTTPSVQISQVNYNSQMMNLSSNSLQVDNTGIYNGSGNNYLSSLTIEGVELNTEFNKENGTYFIEVTEKTELNVSAVAESEEAKVCITGEKNLKSGDNKILISVTAENGNVRYYRIFVTNN